MTLAHPWFLLLLLLVPALVWLRYRPGRRLTFPFSDGEALRRLPATWAVTAHRFLPLVYGLGLALLVVALARPQRGLEESRVRTEAVDIVLVVDCSPSMAAEDLSTLTKRVSRVDAVKTVAAKFVGKRTEDRIGMVAFSAYPYTVAPLTLDHAWLTQRTEELKAGGLGDGTAIGSALASAVNRLRKSQAKSKVIVLLTDGMSNCGEIAPLEAAQAAKALGIKVYTIGAGSNGDVAVPVNFFGQVIMQRQPVEIDEATLQRIATITGARYFRATDLSSLEKIYDEIDQLEKTVIELQQYTRFDEKFMGWLLAGLLLLALEKLLALTRLGGLPA